MSKSSAYIHWCSSKPPIASHASRRTSRNAAIAHGARRGRSGSKLPSSRKRSPSGRTSRPAPDATTSACEMVGNANSECCVDPSGRTSRGAIAPAPGSAVPASSRASIAPGRSAMSAFATPTHGAVVCRATRLTAGPKPRFSCEATSRTHGKRSRTSSGEPSLEALSTTHSSQRPESTSAANDSRQRRSSSRVFQETTATLTSGASCIGRRPYRHRHILRLVRVLAVGNMYPPHHLGGYELVWRSAVEHLRTRGHDVRVVTTDFRLDSPTEPEGHDVHRELRWWWRDHAFPDRPVRERLAFERHNARVLDKHLDAFSPDVLTWWSMGGMSLTLLERVRRRALPAVAFVHDDWLDYGPRVDAWLQLFAGPRRSRVAPVAERLLRTPTHVEFDTAARYMFVSERTRERAIEAGRRPADSGIAHSGIDPAYCNPQPPRAWEWRLLYVGRIDERKGIGTVVEALANMPEASLTIVGSGDPAAEAKLRDRISELGVADRVTIEGFHTRAELPRAYAGADVVVFPVLWEEPWGLVPLESMALGRPVVATGRGGSAEYLRDGHNAVLFEAGDARSLAAAVTRLASDPGLRERLRTGGLETAPRYTETAFNEAVAREVEAVGARP